MVNYSIYPAEEVFDGWDEFTPHYEEMTTQEGTTLMVERIDEKQVVISKIISSNPQDYLNSDLSPGVILKAGLQI